MRKKVGGSRTGGSLSISSAAEGFLFSRGEGESDVQMAGTEVNEIELILALREECNDFFDSPQCAWLNRGDGPSSSLKWNEASPLEGMADVCGQVMDDAGAHEVHYTNVASYLSMFDEKDVPQAKGFVQLVQNMWKAVQQPGERFHLILQRWRVRIVGKEQKDRKIWGVGLCVILRRSKHGMAIVQPTQVMSVCV